ncbi:MAG: dihydrodipicolinate synthase family protein [Pirellulales bacterium]|jgi:dihydrodipicolinate synthase/N-acetylneuraminate lyase
MTSEEILADPILNYPQATVACFDPTTGDLPRRALDEPRLCQYLEKLSQAGAPAILLGASTGHGHLRTVEELEAWFKVADKANTGDMVKMALLRPEDGIAANRHLLSILKINDYSVVFVRPSTGLTSDSTDDEVIESMIPIIEEAAKLEMAIGVYSISDVSGAPLSARATEYLLDEEGGKNIVAAKITEADYLASTRQYLISPQLAHLKIVQGWDPHMAQALLEGPSYDIEARQRVGVTSGPMSFAVHQYTHMFEAAARQDWDEVQAAQSAVTRLFEAMQDDPRKFADLQRAKVIMGLGQPITGEVTEEQTRRVLGALDNLPRKEDQQRLAKSLNLMGDGPSIDRLKELGG